ncbi:MAG TPA: GNAT family N-acetyltransferase [Casimicrobiaceae bacterium]
MSDAPPPSERLDYEPLAVAHTPALSAWSDPQLYRWIGTAPTIAELAMRIERITTRPPPAGEIWRNWVARRRADGACVGVVEATVHGDADPRAPCRAPSSRSRGEDRVRGARAHLAYFIFTAFQRQGYAREACAAAIAHLHDAYDVDDVVASVDTRNTASQRLLDSLQFVRDAQPVASSIDDVPSRDYVYRLTLG